jgi:23S rRNA pseudoU1915 N3-methylase RlmH
MKKGKKFIALFLAFSLMMLSTNLYSKERRGAKLIIIKKDGQQIEGELIAVKPNSLLLLDAEGKDVSFDIADIKVIRIVKKSKASTGIGIGLAIGGASGVYFGLKNRAAQDLGILNILYIFYFFWPPLWFKYDLGSMVLGGSIGAVVGGFIGAAIGKDKAIQIEGMTDSEIQEAMDKLRKKARIRNYK